MKFSVILPVYNAEKVLERSINSVLNQTFSDFEIIAVDDGSKDQSLQVLKKYAELDSRIKVFHQSNKGPGATRNRAISLSQGEYIAFLDADDYWEQDFLEAVLEASNNNQNDLIFIDTVKEKEDGTIIQDLKVYRNKGLSREQMICAQMTGMMPWGMSKVLKRNLIDTAQGEFLEINVGEEAIFSYELLKNAQSVGFVEKPIYHYVQNEDGQHTKGNDDPWHPLADAFKNYLVANGEFEKYSSVINGLAFKGFTISVYRISVSPVLDARKKMKNKYLEYCEDFDFKDIDFSYLDRNTKMIYSFVKFGVYVPVILASKVRRIKRRIN